MRPKGSDNRWPLLQPCSGLDRHLVGLSIGSGVMVVATVVQIPHVAWILMARELLIPTHANSCNQSLPKIKSVFMLLEERD